MKLPRVYTFGTVTRAFLTGLAVAAPRKVYPANQTVDPTV